MAITLDRRPGRSGTAGALLARASTWAWGAVAADHLRMGVDLLCSARVVVTDRLHAHVLCVLLGIPHVVTDNVSGKIRAFHDAWTLETPLAVWTDSLQRGVELARELAAAC
ncbi:MAG TPA: polysaccharide pyruvyl transferase family protein [Solirubrobacteraceae bacterium]|jgi:pyruvyl transferase EpsO|nr:polysaccharide pyruvyl transferase family protein [Solirubrobacteraceae bacterium]